MAAKPLKTTEGQCKLTEKTLTTPSLIREKRLQIGCNPSPKSLLRLSDDQLKVISKLWTPEEWEYYLSLIEVGLTEELLSNPNDLEGMAQTDGPKAIFGLIREAHPEQQAQFERAIRKLMRKHLSKREYQTLWLRFWGQLTTQQIADKLGIARMNVRRSIERGEDKMKKPIFLEALKNSSVLKMLTD